MVFKKNIKVFKDGSLVLLALSVTILPFKAEAKGNDTYSDVINIRNGDLEADVHAKFSAAIKFSQQGHNVLIEFDPGVYQFKNAIEINNAGPKGSIKIKSSSNDNAVITGAIIPDEILLKSTNKSANQDSLNNNIRTYSLGQFNFNDFDQNLVYNKPTSENAIVVLKGENRLNEARWPTTGYYYIDSKSIIDNNNGTLSVKIPSDLMKYNISGGDSKIGGFFSFDWSYQSGKIISLKNNIITFQKLYDGSSRLNTARFKIYNSESMIKLQESYVIDPFSKKLTVYSKSNDKLYVSYATNVIVINNSSNVELDGLIVDGSRGDAIKIYNSNDIKLIDSFIGFSGRNAINIKDSKNIVISYDTVSKTGEGGIVESSKYKSNLEKSGVTIDHSIFSYNGISLPTYRPSINIDDVGVLIDSCIFYMIPHSAIIYSGNDNRIINNTFKNIVTDTGDSGAVYSFRDLTARGTVVENNIFSDIGGSDRKLNNGWWGAARGVYLDAWTSGNIIKNNTFYNTPISIWVGGGSNNDISGNRFFPSVSNIQAGVFLFGDKSSWNGRVGFESRSTLSNWSNLITKRYNIDPSKLILDGVTHNNTVDNNIMYGSGIVVETKGGGENNINNNLTVNSADKYESNYDSIESIFSKIEKKPKFWKMSI